MRKDVAQFKLNCAKSFLIKKQNESARFQPRCTLLHMRRQYTIICTHKKYEPALALVKKTIT